MSIDSRPIGSGSLWGFYELSLPEITAQVFDALKERASITSRVSGQMIAPCRDACLIARRNESRPGTASRASFKGPLHRVEAMRYRLAKSPVDSPTGLPVARSPISAFLKPLVFHELTDASACEGKV